MKTQVTAFGFEVLVTYLLPGILATLAVFVWHGVDVASAKSLVLWAKEAQFLASFILLSMFALLGALIASLQAVLESVLLDKLTPKRLKKTSSEFNSEWEHYIHNLPNNSYISRVVLFFQFETRLGLAALILGVSLIKLSFVHALIFIILGLVFYWVGSLHHTELGAIREGYFNNLTEDD